MQFLLQSISQWMSIPAICLICSQYHYEKAAICHVCQRLLTPLGACCERCAEPIPMGEMMLCGVCAISPAILDRTYIKWQFKEPLRGLLHRFKYAACLELTDVLTTLIIEALPSDFITPDCFVPVPMHPQRLRERGFNHAALLARCLAKRLNGVFSQKLIQKVRHTETQVSLSGDARKKNLKDAFAVAMPLVNIEHVVLVDDLMTTGNTAIELARILKASGVKRVDLCCCARTLR